MKPSLIKRPLSNQGSFFANFLYIAAQFLANAIFLHRDDCSETLFISAFCEFYKVGTKNALT